MAETECVAACNCTYINIMQLFHELKQRFPKVPDQIVTKIIKQNYHDKTACETLLERESSLLQCYPGALISGDDRPPAPLGPISDQCPTAAADRRSSQTLPPASSSSRPDPMPNDASELPTQQPTDVNVSSPLPHSCSAHADDDSYKPLTSLERKIELANIPLGQLVREARDKVTKRGCDSSCDKEESPAPVRPTTLPCDILQSSLERVTLRSPSSSSCSSPSSVDQAKLPPPSPSRRSPRGRASPAVSPSSALPSRTSPRRATPPTVNTTPSPNRLAPPSIGNPFANCSYPPRLPPNDLSSNTPKPTSEPSKDFELAVECFVQPSPPGDQQRSFTSVNLTLRPPSAETTLPINISSGQSLTYTSASFDPRQGYQSHLQIRIGPALLQQQRERKELLARKLEQNKERLRAMQMREQTMKLALARSTSNHFILSKLKADISRLRGACERLTAAVDAYSAQNQQAANLPLGETDEDFYRNIYTGQRPQRAGWSCQLCTFRNHPLLAVCEACEMPRLTLGSNRGPSHTQPSASPSASASVLSNPAQAFPNNNNPSCSAGETSTSVSRTITPLQER